MNRFARSLVLVLSSSLCGCSTFRAAVRDLNNTDLVGEPAPALEFGEWVDGEAQLDGHWTLVAFLLPW